MNSMIGKTVVEINITRNDDDISDFIEFICSDKTKFKMHHCQDCCEYVYIEDINGNIENLLNEPILRFDEKSEDNLSAGESGTYTFYTIATKKGYVDIRWNGESNGYYSESVTIEELTK